MQQITVDMIDTKEFKIKPRGYDQQEVDDFLDAIGDEMVRQLDLIQSLQQQLQPRQPFPSDCLAVHMYSVSDSYSKNRFRSNPDSTPPLHCI